MNCNNAFTVLLLVLGAICESSSNTDDSSTANVTICPDLKPQTSLNWTKIMGKWYVVEVIKHSIDPMLPMSSSRVVLKTCPTVELRFTGGGKSTTDLKLVWTEDAGNLDYSFAVDSPREPGRWIPSDLQNGTLMGKGYVQFVGVVQVMKAVDDHMVLTFCSTAFDNRKYSILLSREQYLLKNNAKKVQDLLSLRGLTNVVIQETCRNAGFRKEFGNVNRWIAMLFALAVTKTARTL